MDLPPGEGLQFPSPTSPPGDQIRMEIGASEPPPQPGGPCTRFELPAGCSTDDPESTAFIGSVAAWSEVRRPAQAPPGLAAQVFGQQQRNWNPLDELELRD